MNLGKAQNALNDIKDSVIGLYKEYGEPWALVIEANDNLSNVDIITVSSLGAISETWGMPTRHGKTVLFPDGKNMNQLLNDPFEWREFINTNFKDFL